MKKNCWRYYHFTYVYQKSQSYDVLPETQSETEFLPFWAILCSFTSLMILKIKLWNNEKNAWRYYPFAHVWHKWRSKDIWFLKYKTQQTEFSVILGHFLPFHPLTTQKIKILKNWKKYLVILSFYTCAP